MASGGHSNRRGGGGGGGGGGWGGFGGFPEDPFANFGFGMGMGGPARGGGGGGNIFDMFDNDPFFNDPFFSRPFGSLFGGQGGGLFGQGLIGGNSFFPNQQQAPPRGPFGYLDNRPHDAPVQQRDPIVVELDDDDDADEARAPSRSSQEPIIEHPDDDVRPAATDDRQPHSMIRQAGPLSVPRSNGGRAYSFQSSSVSYGGPNGTYYSSSATRRSGPNGVIEEEFQEKDSTAGHELQRTSRGLGDKGRSIARKRTSEGREDTLETLHNLQEEEVPDFVRTWEERAKGLPQWNKNRPHTIGSTHGSASPSLRGALENLNLENGRKRLHR